MNLADHNLKYIPIRMLVSLRILFSSGMLASFRMLFKRALLVNLTEQIKKTKKNNPLGMLASLWTGPRFARVNSKINPKCLLLFGGEDF